MRQYGFLSRLPRYIDKGEGLTVLPSCEVCSTKMCPNGELPSNSQQTDRHQPDTEVREKPVSQFIIAPRAQASRRCETQAR